MPKRAERRHHEERVKDKFRRVARGFWSRLWPLDSRAKRDIEANALRMAHHPRHDCEMCREDPKSEKRRKEFEVARKAPLEEE